MVTTTPSQMDPCRSPSCPTYHAQGMRRSPCGENVDTLDAPPQNHKEWDTESSRKEGRQAGERWLARPSPGLRCEGRRASALIVTGSPSGGAGAGEGSAESALRREGARKHTGQRLPGGDGAAHPETKSTQGDDSQHRECGEPACPGQLQVGKGAVGEVSDKKAGLAYYPAKGLKCRQDLARQASLGVASSPCVSKCKQVSRWSSPLPGCCRGEIRIGREML